MSLNTKGDYDIFLIDIQSLIAYYLIIFLLSYALEIPYESSIVVELRLFDMKDISLPLYNLLDSESVSTYLI